MNRSERSPLATELARRRDAAEGRCANSPSSGLSLDVPSNDCGQALQIVADLAVADGLAGPLLFAAIGRPGLPAAFSVL